MADSKVVSGIELDVLVKGLPAGVDAKLILVARGAPDPKKLPFEWPKVENYLKEHCKPASNQCESGVFPLDCTHFVSHSLNKTGIFVQLPSADCASALCIRVNDLAASFHTSVAKYSNVKNIASHAETKKGDFCFIPGWFGIDKNHVMVLADKATAKGASVYGHTESRCGEYVDFEAQDCVYYRIE